ncbi:DUF7522 family protein [Halorussus halobius]|uniref:DUF7522 family protein n=1 Tax=Halorussus halobius TaxID=1710537 RepID=UPI0010920749|nr:hypothetical protein [Halorussus halobius]
MQPASAPQLVEYLRRRVGDDLRRVVCYGEDETDVLFARGDRSDVESDAERAVQYLRHESRSRERRTFPFGELNGTVRSFEDAVVMHFPLAQSRGIVVTLDPNAARQLNAFMDECIDQL